MEFTIQTHESSGVLVIQLQGRLILGDSTSQVRELVKDAVSKGRRKLIFDLGRLEYIDSSGIGTLVGCYTSVDLAGGKVKLLNAVGGVLGTSHSRPFLLRIFENFENEAQAIASFTASAGA